MSVQPEGSGGLVNTVPREPLGKEAARDYLKSERDKYGLDSITFALLHDLYEIHGDEIIYVLGLSNQ